MKHRLFTIVGLSVIVLLLIFFLALNPIKRLKLNEIDSIEICTVPECTIGKAMDQDAKKAFVKAYNGAKPYNDSHGTTHGQCIVIRLKDGETMHVWGGSQGFQTVKRGDKQFNVQGARLLAFFETLEYHLGN